MKKIKVTISINTYRQLLKEIDKTNYDLRKIAHQNISLEPHRQRRRSKHFITQLKILRQHAASMYSAFILGKGWNCPCHISHMARLRLETRNETLGNSNANKNFTAQFKMLLAQRENRVITQYQTVEILSSFEKKTDVVIRNDSKIKSRRVRFDPISAEHGARFFESSLSQNVKLIFNFCSKFCEAQNPGKVVGFVVNNENNKHKHHFTLADLVIKNEFEMKSFGDFLSFSGREPHSTRFLRGERLRVAVIFA